LNSLLSEGLSHLRRKYVTLKDLEVLIRFHSITGDYREIVGRLGFRVD
jgi:hypothetical protein